MRLDDHRESGNIEDRRGQGFGGRGIKVGGVGIVLALVIGYLTGTNPLELLDMMQQGGQPYYEEAALENQVPATDALSRFASVSLASTEDTWNALFRQAGKTYEEPKLVLYSGAIDSACGLGESAMGPFYCPTDRKIYLDLSFFRELDQRFGAPGDFGAAYVIAHEVGHHVQRLLGVTEQVTQTQRGASRENANALSVRLELQADCFAGVWGHHAWKTSQLIEPGDFEEGLAAAAAIGDDRLQRMATGRVQPESWTHGSSQQRTAWLRRGLDSGDPGACDAFGD